jgi:hypothetical protein
MMNLELPFIEGFYYLESEDEWRLDLSDGYLTLWKKPTNNSIWVLSKVDIEDNIYQISSGYDYQIVNSIKAVIRDIKIEELLS